MRPQASYSTVKLWQFSVRYLCALFSSNNSSLFRRISEVYALMVSLTGRGLALPLHVMTS